MSADPPFFATYRPASFCRDFVDFHRDSGQLLVFMACVLGFKPLMDDWIPAWRMEEYRQLCRSYGLHVRADVTKILIPRERAEARAMGGTTLSSTVAVGLPVGAGFPERARANVRTHVFLSRDRDLLRHGMWYPVIVKDRVLWPPYADILTYGRLLGYPDCCIRFFRQRNDWSRFSFLAEIHRESRGAPRHWLCNPLTKDRTYSYIYHMPCRWDCPATRELAGRLRSEVALREPELVRQVDRHLRLPALVFYERKHFVFDGTLQGNRLTYRKVYYPDGDLTGQALLPRLARGDALELEGDTVRVFRDGELVDRIQARSEGFAPEHPFLIQFDRD